MKVQPRSRINRLLGGFGLATLDDPRGLMRQLAYLVDDHDHLKKLLITCEPEERRNMYESLRPYLKFEAKPLDVYLSEGALDAEIEQLPVLMENGRLRAFKVQEIESPEFKAAREALKTVGQKKLLLVCKKCTRQEVFTGATKADAVQAARDAGWTYREQAYRNEESRAVEVCPQCP